MNKDINFYSSTAVEKRYLQASYKLERGALKEAGSKIFTASNQAEGPSRFKVNRVDNFWHSNNFANFGTHFCIDYLTEPKNNAWGHKVYFSPPAPPTAIRWLSLDQQTSLMLAKTGNSFLSICSFCVVSQMWSFPDLSKIQALSFSRETCLPTLRRTR